VIIAMKSHQNVVVIYHFFAHYRAAINQELIEKSSHHVIFAGDNKDPSNSGIKAWIPSDPSCIVHCESHLVNGRFLFQKGVIGLALRKDVDTIVFLGDAQYISTWIGAILARLTGKRVLFWTIGWLRQESGLKDFIRCVFYRLCHGLLLYGNYAKQLAKERGFSEDKLYVIYNSRDYRTQKYFRERITPDQIKNIRQSLFPGSVKPMLVCTSRLVNKRRLDLLLDAMIQLKLDNHEVNLLLIGNGPEKPRLEKIANDNQLSVHFFGECYSEEILAGLVMAANITVAPGMVGLTAMHSLGYGTPVITHNDPNQQSPEWEAIVPGYSGDFFKFGDSHDLARAIRDWTREPLPSESNRKKCYEIIERYYNPAYQRDVIDKAVSGLPAGECE